MFKGDTKDCDYLCFIGLEIFCLLIFITLENLEIFAENQEITIVQL